MSVIFTITFISDLLETFCEISLIHAVATREYSLFYNYSDMKLCSYFVTSNRLIPLSPVRLLHPGRK